VKQYLWIHDSTKMTTQQMRNAEQSSNKEKDGKTMELKNHSAQKNNIAKVEEVEMENHPWPYTFNKTEREYEIEACFGFRPELGDDSPLQIWEGWYNENKQAIEVDLARIDDDCSIVIYFGNKKKGKMKYGKYLNLSPLSTWMLTTLLMRALKGINSLDVPERWLKKLEAAEFECKSIPNG